MQPVIELEAAMKAARNAENTAVANVTVHVNKTANQPGDTTTVKVTAKDAAVFGYNKPEATKNKVTVVDALYKVHSELYRRRVCTGSWQISPGRKYRYHQYCIWNSDFWINVLCK